jgi:hypothetical protein
MTVDRKAPPLSATLDLLGMTVKSGRTRLKRAIRTRDKLIVSKGASQNAKLSMILKRQWKGHRKITPATKQAIVHWIRSHKNVVTSPIYNEKLLVKKQVSIEIEIPVRELHNLLVAPLEHGGLPKSRD